MKAMILSLILATQMWTASAQPDRNVSEYNLNTDGIGFINGPDKSSAQGFDPVSVFPSADGVALQGRESLVLDYKGVGYLFSSTENRDEFLADPEKYEPTYGGYCARAMIEGEKVHINTSQFTIVGNRSFFFVNSRAKRFFDRDPQGNAALADEQWELLSGEAPRL